MKKRAISGSLREASSSSLLLSTLRGHTPTDWDFCLFEDLASLPILNPSREEIISKPIALVHASYRRHNMLAFLRIELVSVSERFAEDIFLGIPLKSITFKQAESELPLEENIARMIQFLAESQAFSQCNSRRFS